MIRRWFGKCEAWDPAYEAVQCKLRHGHDGGHRFGILHTRYLTIDLDVPVTPTYEIPAPFAIPPPGPSGVAVSHFCCHCDCRSPRRDPPTGKSWLEVDQGGV